MSKFESAKINLITGISLFFSHNFISCITLIGASHEVFDTLLKSKSIENCTEFLSNFLKIEQRDIYKILNKVKNWIKHANKDINTEYEPSEDDCIILIALSISAYKILGGNENEETNKFKLFFEKWINQKCS